MQRPVLSTPRLTTSCSRTMWSYRHFPSGLTFCPVRVLDDRKSVDITCPNIIIGVLLTADALTPHSDVGRRILWHRFFNIHLTSSTQSKPRPRPATPAWDAKDSEVIVFGELWVSRWTTSSMSMHLWRQGGVVLPQWVQKVHQRVIVLPRVQCT